MKTLLAFLAMALLVPLVLCGIYLAHGSFESFPDSARQGAARLAAGLGLAFFALLELVAVLVLSRRLRRKAQRRSVPGSKRAG